MLKVYLLLVFTKLFYSPIRKPETVHETIKEELQNVEPAAETIAQPVSDKTKQEEDMVGFQS